MTQNSYSGFTVDLDDRGVAVVTFNRVDKLNAMTQAMKRDLIEWLTASQMNPDVRVVVFTGAGSAFIAGDDLAGYQTDEPTSVSRIGPGHDSAIGTVNALQAYSQAVNLAIRNLNKITIAAINGAAIQTGLSLALSCDLRLASTSAKLGSATLRFALLPDEGGHWLLVQHLGLSRALDFLLNKKIVSASDALAMGLVNEVCAPEDLLTRAMEMAHDLSDGPQTAMALLKRATYVAAQSTWEVAMADIAARTAIADHHPDAKEGIRAFREKRPARFNQAD